MAQKACRYRPPARRAYASERCLFLDSVTYILSGVRFLRKNTSIKLQKSALCHFDKREKSSAILSKISQSLRSFEMTLLFMQLSTRFIIQTGVTGPFRRCWPREIFTPWNKIVYSTGVSRNSEAYFTGDCLDGDHQVLSVSNKR